MTRADEAVRDIGQDPAIRERLSQLMQVDYLGRSAFGKVIDRDFAVWSPIIDKAGLKSKK